MGDGDHRAGPGEQVVGEPGNGLDVEVVGRLVEQQQVGVGDQGRAQRYPPLLAAGQGADDGVQPDVPQAEAGQHAAHRTVRRPGMLGVAERVQHGVLDGAALRQVRALRDERHRGAPLAGNPPGVGGIEPGQQSQQGGLARPVEAEHADPVARLNTERYPVEHGSDAVRDARCLDIDEIRHQL